MSLRSGSGSLSLSNPTKATLRKIGERGRQTQRQRRNFGMDQGF